MTGGYIIRIFVENLKIMALSKKVIENKRFSDFERELKILLSNDDEHALSLCKQLLFKSRRYGCLLSAKGVHLDKPNGDVILVLTHKPGEPIFCSDEDVMPSNEISIPLRECYDDIEASSGEAPRLLERIKDAIMEKYLNRRYENFEMKGLLHDGTLNFNDFEMDFPFMRGTLVSLTKERDGFKLICNNEIAGDFHFLFSRMPLYEVLNVGKGLDKIFNLWNEAAGLYRDSIMDQGVDGLYYSTDKHHALALVNMYDAGYPLIVIDSVAKTFTDFDVFDFRKYSSKEIAEAVANYRSTGELRILRRANVKSCSRGIYPN